MSNFGDFGTDIGVELGWEDTIEKDAPEFVLLPEGDYDFEVTGFERARYNGGEKLPACNQAKIKLQITTNDGIATINHNLFLHSKCEGMLSAFFCAIGQKKHGEKLKMNWNNVIGSKGRAKIGQKVYNDKTYNEVKRFYEPEASTQQSGTNFKPGSF